MKKLHRHLTRRYFWYAKWHEYPHHGFVHVVALLFIIAAIASHVEYGNARTAAIQASPETLAEVNGLHLLKEGEYALLTSVKKSSGKTKKQSFMLKSGDVVTYDIDQAALVTFVEYDPASPMYVPNNANVLIQNITDFTSYNGKIDTAIERTLKSKEKVSVIVRFKGSGRFYETSDSSITRATKSQAFNSAKASVLASVGAGKNVKDLQIINGISIEVSAKALEGLQHNPNVQTVSLDRTVMANLDTSVAEINAPYAWTLVDTEGNPVTGTGMRIAVIDTGVDYTHPDLGGCFGANCKVIGGYDFVNNDTDPMDDQGHGTHVAATAAGKGLLNGVAPDAKILAYKVLDAGGSGSFSGVIAAIQRATDPNNDGNPTDHVDVLSMSLGASCGIYSAECGPDDPGSLAVDNASAIGVVATVAAGNSGPNGTIGTPGTARTAITVAAACKTAQIGSSCSGPIASFSSRGPVIVNDVDLKKPDISAPGVLICAARWANAFEGAPTCFDDHHIRISGTSMATPHMAGVAALMKQANPAYTPAQIKDRLKTTARSLSGVTYNDQGAGEVDVKTAIPIVSKVKSIPDSWNATSIPIAKTSTQTQTFTVTSTDTAITTLTPKFVSPVAGIAFTSSKTVLNVGNKGTDTFTGTITIDNDIAPAGKYNAVIYLQEGSINKGAIIVTITVASTITIDKMSIDYGIDNPSLASWTSTQQVLTVTNMRTDIAQTLTVSSSSFPAGITYTMNPTTLTIPAGGVTTFTTGFSVVNSSVANNTYRGTVHITNALNQTILPISFKKFYTISLASPIDRDLTGAFVMVYEQTGGERSGFIFPTTNPYVVYFNTPGARDVETIYGWTNGDYYIWDPLYKTITEGVSVGGTALLDRSQATRTITATGTTIDGTVYTKETAAETWLEPVSGTNHGSSSSRIYFSHKATVMINPFSSSYQMGLTSYSLATENPYYLFGGMVQGGSAANVTFTNKASDLKKTVVQHDLNKPGSTYQPIIYTCGIDNGCGANYYSDRTLTANTQTIYEVPNIDRKFFALADNNDVIHDHQFRTPFFTVTSHTIGVWPFAEQYASYADMTYIYPTENAVYNGLGPTVWVGRFGNTSNTVQLIKMNEFPPTPFRRQGFALAGNSAVPYTISQNGTQVASGSFDATSPYGWSFGQSIITVPLSVGQYQFQTSYPYQNQGINLTGTVSASFNTALADKNPPSISKLYYYVGSTRADVYDSAESNKLEVDLNPELGTMNTVTLAIAADEGLFVDVPISNTSGTTYTAAIPNLSVTSKLTLRLTASDSANNALTFTFELPKGIAGSVIDRVAPTASITVPVNGATVSGVTTISVTASDNVGVDHVDYYQGSTLIGASAFAPYGITWDTTTVANGSYNITAKAYDAAGNVGTASPVSINISNTTSTPDPNPPTATITAPTNGATVSGNTTVAVRAIDNLSVVKLEVYRGTTLIDTDTTGYPDFAITWNTTGVTDGAYTLTAKAYDNQGNTGTSAPIIVTVRNNAPVPDTTPPTTAIISPVTGSTVKVNTTVPITVNSSDNVGVTKTAVYINGKVACATVPATGCAWKVPKGPGKKYQIQSRAYDAAGNVGTSTTITVTSAK